jgi:tetratricopeptide (TPR) repeat protein
MLLQTPTARHAIGAEIDNVLAAWDWAVLHGDIDRIEQLREGLAIWYELSGLFQEEAEVFALAAAQMHTAPGPIDTAHPALLCVRGHLLVDEASALIALGQHDRACSLLDEAQELAHTADALGLQAACANVQARLLHRRGGVRGAQQQMLQALALARAVRASTLEADCLCYLSRLTLELGDYPQAQTYGERGLALCRALNDRRGAALALLHLGRTASEQGDHAIAKAYLEDSLRSIRMFGYRSGECEILYALGVLCDAMFGLHTEAEAHLAQAWYIARELGDRQAEGRIRAGQGKSALRQGNFLQAQAALEEALTLADEICDRTGEGLAAQGLGLVAYYRGHYEQARDWAQRALGCTQITEQRRQQRCALRLLGHALAGLGQLASAVVTYQQVLDLDQTSGYPHLVLETMADLARVALAQGDQDRAITCVVTIVDDLQDHSLVGVEEPVQVYLTCYQVLEATHDPGAEVLLATGHALLTEQASRCIPAQRHLFLESFPANCALQRLWDQSLTGHVARAARR